MDQPIAQLQELDDKIGEIEEEHNKVMDSNAELAQRQASFLDDALADTQAIQADLDRLRQDIQHRIAWAKRASLSLSLIAQEEELRPVRARIQNQKYEFFATRTWTKSLFEDRPKRGHRDA